MSASCSDNESDFASAESDAEVGLPIFINRTTGIDNFNIASGGRCENTG